MSGKKRIRTISEIGNAALDLLYPGSLYCISCGKMIDESRTYRLCNDCMTAMNWITDRHCIKCGRPLADNDPGEFCFSCAKIRAIRYGKAETFRAGQDCAEIGSSHSFDKGHACAGYGSCEQAMVFSLKYGSRSDIADTIAEIMYDRMVAEYGTGSAAGDSQPLAGMYDLVIPVPIYKKKKSRRGFNQADLIAGSFAKRAHLRYDPEIVIRIKNTVPMKGLSPEERRANISGAFAIRERKLPQLEGKRVLLVDDIFTTGSTLDELAALLKDPRRQLNRRGELRKGVSRVDFLAFAATADIIAE